MKYFRRLMAALRAARALVTPRADDWVLSRHSPERPPVGPGSPRVGDGNPGPKETRR